MEPPRENDWIVQARRKVDDGMNARSRSIADPGASFAGIRSSPFVDELRVLWMYRAKHAPLSGQVVASEAELKKHIELYKAKIKKYIFLLEPHVPAFRDPPRKSSGGEEKRAAHAYLSNYLRWTAEYSRFLYRAIQKQRR